MKNAIVYYYYSYREAVFFSLLCVLSTYLLLKYVPTVPFFALCAIPAVIGTGIIAAYSFLARIKKEEGRVCEKSHS